MLKEAHKQLKEDSSEIPHAQRNRMAFNKAALLAVNLIKNITDHGLFEAFAEAGHRYRAAAMAGVPQQLEDMWQRYIDDPGNVQLLEQLEVEEDKIMKLQEYRTAAGREDQAEILKALDFADAITPGFKIYNVCRAKLPDATTCGLAFPSKLWHQACNSWRFYCKLDWDSLLDAASKEEWGAVPPEHSCTCWVNRLTEEYKAR